MIRLRHGVAIVAYSLIAWRSAAAQGRLQAGMVVGADTVHIATPFHVKIGVRAPRGSTIEFPAPPDSMSSVQGLEDAVVRTIPDSEVFQEADYRVAAWYVGRVPVHFGDVVVHTPTGDRQVAIAPGTVFVASVLPEDTAQRVPKDARGLIASPVVPLWVWALIAALLVIGVIAYLRSRRKQREPKPRRDPYDAAVAAFDRIDALHLVNAGERSQYVALMVGVLREYLDDQLTGAPLSSTTHELIDVLEEGHELPVEHLLALLDEADMIKFARTTVTTERALAMGKEARAIATSVHTVSVVGSASHEPPAAHVEVAA